MDWLGFTIVILCLLVSALLRRERDRADRRLARQHAAALQAG